MPWKGVTVSEDRQRFLEDYRLRYYSVSELAERFGVSRQNGPQVDPTLRGVRPERLPRALPPTLQLPLPDRSRTRRSPRRLAQGSPYLGRPQAARPDAPPAPRPGAPCALHRLLGSWPEKAWSGRGGASDAHTLAAPRLSPRARTTSGPPTTRASSASRTEPTASPSPLATWPPAICSASTPTRPSPLRRPSSTSPASSRPTACPTASAPTMASPFASSALARLSALSVWFIKLGIYPELIEPGRPQQNAVHERMHRTLKQEATIPPASSLPAQQRKLDRFRQEFNEDRPHEALHMKRPAQVYRPSTRAMPRRIEPYDYPAPLPRPPRQPRRHHPGASATRSSSAIPCTTTSSA